MASASTIQNSAADPTRPLRPVTGPSLDYATLFGVLGSFTIIALAMFVSGMVEPFINAPAILIVLGGTFLVTTISYSFDEIVRAQALMLKAVVYHVEEPGQAARRVLQLADEARRKGPLMLESHYPKLRRAPFLHRAVTLIVDGLPLDEVEQVMSAELAATADRHQRSAGVLRRAGEVAPAMGLIGTLIGLVQMLGNLEDPSSIGPAMAVALLTTFYGAVLANMFFLPLANKLERNSLVEHRVNHIYALGAASISRQENPRRLELLLNTILPPAQRVNYFD